MKKNASLHPEPYTLNPSQGFTLIEVLIAIGLFLIVALAIYFTYANLIEIIGRTRTHTLATSLLNKEIEIIRNLPYDSVGLIGGFPPGVIAPSKTITYEGQQFVITTYVRNIDAPFDGTIGGNPNDTAPADHRLIEVRVECPTCFNFVPVWFTTWVAPQNLEASTQNGSLFINVFDANGQAVSSASVLVKNTSTTPTITINDTTNVSGTLQLVDVPTSTNAYQITISKSGYTGAKTYSPGGTGNPNPIQPHATVASQTITEISFAIDRVSIINARSQDYLCQAIPSIGFNQVGERLIGANPDTPAYSSSFTTNSSGYQSITGLGWDRYSFTNTSNLYDLSGSIPLVPLTIDPNTTTPLAFVLEPTSSSSLLVTTINASGTPVYDTSVNLTKAGFNETKNTGERFFNDTSWASGTYTTQDGTIDDSLPGALTLLQSNGVYPTSTNSYLISASLDAGTATTTWRALSWSPSSQPTNTTLIFQLASSDGTSPWIYVGPDGTSNTYYTTGSGSTIGTMHDGKRYLRYKIYFNTTDEQATPSLQDVSIAFSSSCIPSGQAFWRSLATGNYTITATKAGYSAATSSITVGALWHEVRLTMQ